MYAAEPAKFPKSRGAGKQAVPWHWGTEAHRAAFQQPYPPAECAGRLQPQR